MRKSSKNFLIPIILLSSLLFDFNLASKIKSATLRIRDGLNLKCLVWYDNEWNMDLCTTSSITTTSNTATVHCKCSINSYQAVGLVTAGNDIVYTEEIHTYEERIGFKIDENYYEIVKGNKYDFIGSIRAQLVSILQCEPLNVRIDVRDLEVFPESMTVNFTLFGFNDMEADELKQSHAELIALLEAGALKLEYPVGREMKVPKQCIKTSGCDEAEYLEKASAFFSKAAWGTIESIKDLVHTILHYSKKLHRLILSLSDENTSLKKISCPHLNSSKGCFFFDQHAHTPTWQMAQDYCTSLGPDYGLAEIYDEETHELIRNHGTNIGSNFDWWLGAVSSDKGQDGVLRRPATQVKWIWQRTGKELKYTNWADDMEGYLLGGDCLQMWRTQSLKWDDVDCNDGGSENKPICQKFA